MLKDKWLHTWGGGWREDCSSCDREPIANVCIMSFNNLVEHGPRLWADCSQHMKFKWLLNMWGDAQPTHDKKMQITLNQKTYFQLSDWHTRKFGELPRWQRWGCVVLGDTCSGRRNNRSRRWGLKSRVCKFKEGRECRGKPVASSTERQQETDVRGEDRETRHVQARTGSAHLCGSKQPCRDQLPRVALEMTDPGSPQEVTLCPNSEMEF